jgi:C1A family cysteine protease
MKKKRLLNKNFSKLLAIVLAAGLTLSAASGKSGKTYADETAQAGNGYIEMEGSWDEKVPATAEDADLSDVDVIHVDETEQTADTKLQFPAETSGSGGKAQEEDVPEESAAENTEEVTARDGVSLQGSAGASDSGRSGMDETVRIGEYEVDMSGDGTELTAWPFTGKEAAADKSKSLLRCFPKIRNQGQYNTCWAFTATGLMEMSMLRQNAVDTNVDYSELALAYSTYNLPNDRFGGLEGDSNNLLNGLNFLTSGGNMVLALPTLFTWAGSVAEIDVPYSTAPSVLRSGLSARMQRKDQAHIKDMVLFNRILNPNAVKKWIRENGATSGLMLRPSDYMDYYNEEHNAYLIYYNDYLRMGMTSNHAVDIVGWDDAFPGSAFKSKRNPNGAPINGAWLIRNSWGLNGYGLEGYFWMSYADNSLGGTLYGVRAERADKYENNYQYDGAGYSVDVHNWRGANIFRTQAGTKEVLRAVAVGLSGSYVDFDTSYEIQIYKNLKDPTDPMSGELCPEATISGKPDQAGIYTLELNAPVELEGDTLFSVVVLLDGTKTKVIAESSYVDRDLGLEVKASMKRNQSFIWLGDKSKWMDLADAWTEIYNYDKGGGNLRIKAFTDTVEGGKPEKEAIPMYRLYNGITREHFYTAGAYEREVLKKVGWKDEGIGWYAPKTGKPVYRLYNGHLKDHHYTISKGERDFLISVGWNDEGIGWYSDIDEEVPVYRQFHPLLTSGSHNYTVSRHEADVLIAHGWKDEGIGWYGVDPLLHDF